MIEQALCFWETSGRNETLGGNRGTDMEGGKTREDCNRELRICLEV